MCPMLGTDEANQTHSTDIIHNTEGPLIAGGCRQASFCCSSQEMMMIKSRPGAKGPGVESQPSFYAHCGLGQVAYPLWASVSSSLKSGLRIATFEGGGYKDSRYVKSASPKMCSLLLPSYCWTVHRKAEGGFSSLSSSRCLSPLLGTLSPCQKIQPA